MLRKFVNGQKFTIVEIVEALDANDWDIAERIAHNLKGGSANIGAPVLQQLAQNLETIIRERQPRKAVDLVLDELKKPLKILITQLEQNLPKEQDKTPVKVDRKKLRKVCEKLDKLLASADVAAREVLAENKELLDSAFPTHFRRIDVGIRSFDFAAALSALRAATTTSA